MSSNNEKIAYKHRVDYKEVLCTAREIQDLSTKQIIDDACLVLNNCSAVNLLKCSLYISAFRRELRERIEERKECTDVQSEGLNKLSHSLSNCLEALRSSNKLQEAFVMIRLDKWMKEQHFTISNQEEVEHAEDHYGHCNSNNVSMAQKLNHALANREWNLNNELILEAIDEEFDDYESDEDFTDNEIDEDVNTITAKHNNINIAQELDRERNLNNELILEAIDEEFDGYESDEDFTDDNELNEDYSDLNSVTIRFTISNQEEVEHAEDHYGHCNSNNVSMAQKLNHALANRERNLNNELILEAIDEEFDDYESDEDFTDDNELNEDYSDLNSVTIRSTDDIVKGVYASLRSISELGDLVNWTQRSEPSFELAIAKDMDELMTRSDVEVKTGC